MKIIASAVAKINLIFLILAVITIAVVNGDSSHLKKCEGDWEKNTANGKCYKIFYDEPVSFMECASKCVSYNASMLCIKNADENDFYGSKMRGRADRVWIGLYDETDDYPNRFKVNKWSNVGCESDFTSWVGHEPTSRDIAMNRNEKCVAIIHWGWIDFPCTAQAQTRCACERSDSDTASLTEDYKKIEKLKKLVTSDNCLFCNGNIIILTMVIATVCIATLIFAVKYSDKRRCKHNWKKKKYHSKTKLNENYNSIYVKIPNYAIPGQMFIVKPNHGIFTLWTCLPGCCFADKKEHMYEYVEQAIPAPLEDGGEEFKATSKQENETVTTTQNVFSATGQPLQLLCPLDAKVGDVIEILTPKCELQKVDMKAHNGFRGLLSLHIAIFHYFLWNKDKRFGIGGSAIMPLFFLLSGYTLGVVYGGKPGIGASSRDGSYCSCSRNDKKFYRNRFARIMPTFWLSNLLCVPVIFYGQHYRAPPDVDPVGFAVGAFDSITAIGLGFFPFSGPGWTICTFFWLYLCFPRILKTLQYTKRKVDVMLLGGLHGHILAMLFVLICLLIGLEFSSWFFFITGCFYTLPINWFSCGILLGLTSLTMPINSIMEPEIWAKDVDFFCGLFYGTLLACSIVSFMGYESGVGLWAQTNAWTAIIGLRIIFGLTRDNGQSLFGRLLRSNFCQYMGRLSLQIYLLHTPVLFYFHLLYYGPLVWTKETKTTQLAYNSKRRNDHMPFWGIIICMLVTIVLSIILEMFFEKPLRSCIRRCLGEEKKKKKENNDDAKDLEKLEVVNVNSTSYTYNKK